MIALLALLLTVLPLSVMAAGEAVTINTISDVTQGSNVTVSGTSTLGNVTVKVLKPDSTIYDYDSVPVVSGAYTYTFKVASTASTGDYTVVVGSGSQVATKTFKVNTAPTGCTSNCGPGPSTGPGSDTPGTIKQPEISPGTLTDLGNALSNLPPVGAGTSGNERNKQATKAAASAIKAAGTVDASSLVTKNADGSAQVKLSVDSLKDTFKAVSDIAKTVNGALKDAAPDAKPAKVVVTLNLGNVEGGGSIGIGADVVAAAKAAGVDVIAVEVNGVTLEVNIADAASGVTLDIKPAPTSAVSSVSSDPIASDPIEFQAFPPPAPGDGATVAPGGSVPFAFTGFDAGMAVSFTLTGENAAGATLAANDLNPKVAGPLAATGKLDPKYLTLAKVTDKGLEYLAGSVDPDTGKLNGKIHSSGIYVVVEHKVDFNDIASVKSWAGDAISISASKGIINGIGSNKFNPTGDVTRAEFATLLVKALGLSTNGVTEKFDDVKDGAWYQPYVAAAAKAGLVNGRSATKFDPTAKITRAEIATMAANGLTKVLNYKDVSNVDSVLAKFNDASGIQAFAKSSVALLTDEGIVQGKTASKFDPKGYASRAEAAVIIYKLFNLI